MKGAGYEEGFKAIIWTNDSQQRVDTTVLLQNVLKEINVDSLKNTYKRIPAKLPVGMLSGIFFYTKRLSVINFHLPSIRACRRTGIQ